MKAVPRIPKGALVPRRSRRLALGIGRMALGPPLHDVQYHLVRRSFLVGLALTYAIAFASIAVQISGLIGSRGILPAAELLARVEEGYGFTPWWRLPTLFWFGANDLLLSVVAWAGVGAALLAVIGMAPRLMFALLWAGYLSIVSVGGAFLSFQWDTLLLEAGLLAIFFAPGGLWPTWRGGRPPSRVGLWMLRWLLFRLMFLSGCMKLGSGDLTWPELTALDFHYWSQPLPNVVAWFAFQLPQFFSRFACAATLLIELLAVFLIFAPRRLRAGASLLFLVLLGAITLTGNYGFFTLLAAVLCITLFDDSALLAVTSARLRARLMRDPVQRARPRPVWRSRLALGLALPVVVLTTARALLETRVIDSLPEPLEQIDRLAAPFRSFNAYGLFRVMTTERPEIVIEGSLDGESWRTYEFGWKPGALDHAPAFAGPYMPRLDWQMWFAALRSGGGVPAWYEGFTDRLLEAEPAVLGLLAHDPFDGKAPRFIRSTLYSYRFTDPSQRARTGDWWRRELIGSYVRTKERR